ncbi:MAG: 30S ribosomal protein S8e [Methanobacteriota archaeon]|nr:MAG: 30S ribosomal protein S8e [Euryarchaeota archaeon]
MLWQGRSVRKATGGRYISLRAKRRFEIGRASADTTIGESRIRNIRTQGGNLKVRALRAQYATVSNRATGETRKVLIETVVANSADPNYVRRNILTKGAIIKTELGNAKIMSRPGQDGVVNAVLLAERTTES